MESKTPVKDRLTKKIKKRGHPQEDDTDPNIFEMLGKVNEMLKQNPEMLNKVNKCVSTIMDNKDFMDKLSSQIKENIKLEDPTGENEPEIELNAANISSIAELMKDDVIQALDNSELGDSLTADSNESTQ
jgi:hypothetical protein